MAIALSALLKKPIKITQIRAGRKKPGLAAQHLNGNATVYEKKPLKSFKQVLSNYCEI